MKRINIAQNLRSGFTIVELLVVIVVMGILVTIVYSGVGAVLTSSKENELQTALTGARYKIEEYKKKEGVYPKLNELPAGTIPSNYANNYFYAGSYAWAGAGTVYCLEIKDIVGVWPSNYLISYHVSSINNDPLPGSCSGFQQEVLGNGLGGETVTNTNQYGELEVEAKTPLKGSFRLSRTTTPPGYVSTALVRAAVYLNGTYSSSMTTTQYGSYVSGGGTATWYIGSVNYGSSTAVVKVEWQDPVNGWSELIPVTLPPPESP